MGYNIQMYSGISQLSLMHNHAEKNPTCKYTPAAKQPKTYGVHGVRHLMISILKSDDRILTRRKKEAGGGGWEREGGPMQQQCKLKVTKFHWVFALPKAFALHSADKLNREESGLVH